MDAFTRAALILEAIDAALVELRELGDPGNHELIARLEREGERCARELARLAEQQPTPDSKEET